MQLIKYDNEDWCRLSHPDIGEQEAAESLAQLLECQVHKVYGANGANCTFIDGFISEVCSKGALICQFDDIHEVYKMDDKLFVISFVEGARLIATAEENIIWVGDYINAKNNS